MKNSIFEQRRLELLEGLGWGPISMAEYYWMLERMTQHCTMTAVADFLGVTGTTISKDLRDAGLPRPPPWRPPKLYAGRPLVEIAAEEGVSVPAIYHRIRNNGSPELGPRWRGRRYNGKTIRQMAEEAGVTYRVMWGQINKSGLPLP